MDHVIRTSYWLYYLSWRLLTFAFLNYVAINCKFCGLVARQPACHGNQLVPHSLWVVIMLATKYELDMITQYWVIALFIWIRYVTLWLWPFTFWPQSHVTWCHMGVQSSYQVWNGYDFPFAYLQNVPRVVHHAYSIQRLGAEWPIRAERPI